MTYTQAIQQEGINITGELPNRWAGKTFHGNTFYMEIAQTLGIKFTLYINGVKRAAATDFKTVIGLIKNN